MASSEELLRAVQLATRTLSSGGRIDTVLHDVLQICVTAVGASGGTIYLHDARNERLVFRHVLPESVREKIQFDNIPDTYGVAGESFTQRKTIISRFENDRDNPIEEQTGVQVKSMITVPLGLEGEPPIGVVQLINKLDGDFNDDDAIVLDTVSAVSTMAFLNSRLMDEQTRASTLLGMGKVGHDIGNLAASLYAGISFSDLALNGLKTAVTEKDGDPNLYIRSLEEMVEDLRASVDRIVGYSRLISDLSAGRELRPNKKLTSMADAIANSAAYLESDARQYGIEMHYDIQQDAPNVELDELFIFRIVQNLVGNAVKAVREASPIEQPGPDDHIGTVCVRYRVEGGMHVLEVQDSGPGMTRDVADRILMGEGRSEWAKGGGSGWGTKIVLELTRAHNGTVDIDSAPGKGTTFRVKIPA
jgi:signal transduction histidine kinase